ncbi:MAG: DUF1284 domain-containing protein [Planctomycetota bacterium]|nr:DUF1284 domain-containing protein [Planctomycetota bacterium]
MMFRGHNLLCIQGYVGKGYSPEFVENMTLLTGMLADDTPVTLLDVPDLLCAACPHLVPGLGCELHGPGTEEGIVRQDRDVLDRLGFAAGETIHWGDVKVRIAERIAPDDLDDICGKCPWLGLGHCKTGLAKLRAATP